MKRILVLGLLFLICGCGKTSTNVTSEYTMPPELNDCVAFRMYNGGLSNITVIRCPNSTTTTKQSDKAGTTTVVIDGVTYVKQ